MKSEKITFKVNIYIMAYGKIPVCLWYIEVQLHTFGQKWYVSKRTTEGSYLSEYLQGHSNKANFTHCKSIETISCQSSESTWTCNNGNKNASFAQAKCYEHFCKISALSSLWLLRRLLDFFFHIFSILVAIYHDNQSNLEIWTKMICLVED